MSDTTEKTYSFFDAVRENTGRHMLDSGGAYGRHHEKPPVSHDDPAVTWDPKWMDTPATLSTAHFLTEALDIRDDLMAEFDEWAEGREGGWFELGEDFMKSLGYTQEARDNVYNGENDLSQVFIWEVWLPEDTQNGEWPYADDAVTVIYVHTGCDVRGGYTRPYFTESNGEYSTPLHFTAEYFISESRTMSDDDMRKVDEKWATGWSSYPFGEVESRVTRWFPWASKGDSRVALLDTGDVVVITAGAPYLG